MESLRFRICQTLLCRSSNGGDEEAGTSVELSNFRNLRTTQSVSYPGLVGCSYSLATPLPSSSSTPLRVKESTSHTTKALSLSQHSQPPPSPLIALFSPIGCPASLAFVLTLCLWDKKLGPVMFSCEIFAVKKKSDSTFAEKLQRLKVGGKYGWEEVDLGCLGDDVTLFLGPYGSCVVPCLSNAVGMEKKKVFVADLGLNPSVLCTTTMTVLRWSLMQDSSLGGMHQFGFKAPMNQKCIE
ncbi:hypothetical protein ACE6H2_023505 [Prunus campanulata]